MILDVSLFQGSTGAFLKWLFTGGQSGFRIQLGKLCRHALESTLHCVSRYVVINCNQPECDKVYWGEHLCVKCHEKALYCTIESDLHGVTRFHQWASLVPLKEIKSINLTISCKVTGSPRDRRPHSFTNQFSMMITQGAEETYHLKTTLTRWIMIWFFSCLLLYSFWNSKSASTISLISLKNDATPNLMFKPCNSNLMLKTVQDMV